MELKIVIVVLVVAKVGSSLEVNVDSGRSLEQLLVNGGQWPFESSPVKLTKIRVSEIDEFRLLSFDMQKGLSILDNTVRSFEDLSGVGPIVRNILGLNKTIENVRSSILKVPTQASISLMSNVDKGVRNVNDAWKNYIGKTT
jgi:hypothetical protein